MSLISSNMPIHLMAITCLDFDSDSYPLELAIALPNGQHYQAWIKPSDSVLKTLPQDIVNTVNKCGKYPDQVCNEINLLCAGSNIYCDHWGLTTKWLANLFLSASVERAFTCSPIEALLEEEDQANWNARKQFVLDILKADDFSADSQLDVIQSVVNLFYRDQPCGLIAADGHTGYAATETTAMSL